jgi:hypothetical protein
VRSLTECGLLAAAEIQAVLAQVPATHRHDARTLAQEFVRRRKLTDYQASNLCEGKSRGLVLGNYAILDKLGQGGMGIVFKALDRRSNRVVAVKVLPPSVTQSPHAVQRFQREVRAAVQLNHANIVAALASGVVDGVHFFVMEFVDGSDLQRLIKTQGPLPVPQAVGCIYQAAHGLAHAHAAGIVHRDIKPSNLLLARSQTQATIKILDMGLARFDASTAPGAGEIEDLTRTGSILGTTDYMAPEQALNTKRADRRADIYSLGCTLYYLLTGRTVYAGETAMEKLLAHREQPVPSLRSVRAEIPAALDGLFQRMAAKRPEERFQTMAEVIAALEALPAGARPSLAPPPMQALELQPGPGFGAGETRRRRRLGRWSWLVTAGVAACIGTLVIVLVSGSAGRPSAAVVARPSSAATVDRAAGWVSLFNGKDLTGWHVQTGKADVWKVKGGNLTFADPPAEGWLVTDQPFADFEFRLEFLLTSGSDSGVGLRLSPRGETVERLEVQIRDEAKDNPPGDALVTGSLCHLAAAIRPATRPAGQWNDMRITASGSHISVDLNGSRTLEADLADARTLTGPVHPVQREPRGSIGLQCFAGSVQFRNLQVRPITSR